MILSFSNTEISEERIVELISKAIKPYKMSETHDMTEALCIDPDSELIVKLHNAYVEFSDDHKNLPQSIGGGTYAKEK